MFGRRCVTFDGAYPSVGFGQCKGTGGFVVLAATDSNAAPDTNNVVVSTNDSTNRSTINRPDEMIGEEVMTAVTNPTATVVNDATNSSTVDSANIMTIDQPEETTPSKEEVVVIYPTLNIKFEGTDHNFLIQVLSSELRLSLIGRYSTLLFILSWDCFDPYASDTNIPV